MGYSVSSEVTFLIYRTLEELSQLNIPVVFKGATTLKQIEQVAYVMQLLDTERNTKDLDIEWIGKTPTMEEITGIINIAVKLVKSDLRAVAYREYGEDTSAGFYVCQGDIRLFKIDINVNDKERFYTTYRSVIN